jgi:hypothetical protein
LVEGDQIKEHEAAPEGEDHGDGHEGAVGGGSVHLRFLWVVVLAEADGRLGGEGYFGTIFIAGGHIAINDRFECLGL